MNDTDSAIVSSDSEAACTNTATGAKEEEETSIHVDRSAAPREGHDFTSR